VRRRFGGRRVFLDGKTGKVQKRKGHPVLAGIIFAKTGLGRCSSEEKMLNADSFGDWVNSKR
jgi:hypothetical protein